MAIVGSHNDSVQKNLALLVLANIANATGKGLGFFTNRAKISFFHRYTAVAFTTKITARVLANNAIGGEEEIKNDFLQR